MPFRRTSIDSNQRTGFYSPKLSRVVGSRNPDGFDADALIYINAVEAADGEALEFNIKTAYNAFVVGCKSDSIWSAIKASCIMAGARTLSGALTPLVGTAPTNFNFVAGDYDRKTGLVGNASTKYLNTNRNNNADPQNSKHIAAFVSSADSASKSIIGSDSTTETGTSLIFGGSSSVFFTRHNSSTGTSNSSNLALGLAGVNRNLSTSYTQRVDGANTTVLVASQTPRNASLFVYRRGSGAPDYSSHRISFYSIGESLDLALLDNRVTRLVNEIAFFLNTGLDGGGYDIDTLKYVNAGYAAGGSLS